VPPLDAELLASYIPENAATLTASLIAPDKTRFLVRQALIESIVSEDPKLASMTKAMPSSTRFASGQRSETNEQRVSSLSMLTRMLSKPGDSAFSSTMTATVFLNSFEGLGDQAVASPYSVLLGEQRSYKYAQPEKRGGDALASNLRSVSLLQQRLDASENDNNKPHKRGIR
jgi:hypothetical protein